MQNQLLSLERSIPNYIGMSEDKLLHMKKDPFASEVCPERNNFSLKPLPESMRMEDLLTDKAVGIRKNATTGPATTTSQKPPESDPQGQKLTQEDIQNIQNRADCEGKVLYFFYGTLMDPASLQRVTGLQAAPRMRPAHVVGYTTKLWGPFPVLLHGERDDVVRGVACEIEGSGSKRRLKDYEGKDFDEWELDLRLDKPDGMWEVARGVTFKWVGPRDELEEGNFSLNEWQSI